MNIAVINAKDLFRYILKFLVIVSITFFMIKLVKTVDLKKQEENIKENGNNIKKPYSCYYQKASGKKQISSRIFSQKKSGWIT